MKDTGEIVSLREAEIAAVAAASGSATDKDWFWREFEWPFPNHPESSLVPATKLD